VIRDGKINEESCIKAAPLKLIKNAGQSGAL